MYTAIQRMIYLNSVSMAHSRQEFIVDGKVHIRDWFTKGNHKGWFTTRDSILTKYQSGSDNSNFKNGQDVCNPVSVRLVVHARPQAEKL